jgi:hypothetical protein
LLNFSLKLLTPSLNRLGVSCSRETKYSNCLEYTPNQIYFQYFFEKFRFFIFDGGNDNLLGAGDFPQDGFLATAWLGMPSKRTGG